MLLQTLSIYWVWDSLSLHCSGSPHHIFPATSGGVQIETQDKHGWLYLSWVPECSDASFNNTTFKSVFLEKKQGNQEETNYLEHHSTLNKAAHTKPELLEEHKSQGMSPAREHIARGNVWSRRWSHSLWWMWEKWLGNQQESCIVLFSQLDPPPPLPPANSWNCLYPLWLLLGTTLLSQTASKAY